MTRFGIALPLTSAALAFTVGCAVDSPLSKGGQEVETPGPVQLLYASLSFDRELGSGNCPGDNYGYAYGFIEVDNIAYEKEVVVHYTTDRMDEWKEVAASYLEPTHGNREAWYFRTPSELFPKEPQGHCVDYEFAVSYTVAGQTYWDNGDGSDYHLRLGGYPDASSFLLERSALAVQWASAGYGAPPRFSGAVSVQNTAYEKEIVVVYSGDGWNTVNEVTATFWETEFPTGAYETWTFEAPIPTGSEEIEFAVRYTVAGQTHWDNHFHRNYRVDVPGQINADL